MAVIGQCNFCGRIIAVPEFITRRGDVDLTCPNKDCPSHYSSPLICEACECNELNKTICFFFNCVGAIPGRVHETNC